MILNIAPGLGNPRPGGPGRSPPGIIILLFIVYLKLYRTGKQNHFYARV